MGLSLTKSTMQDETIEVEGGEVLETPEVTETPEATETPETSEAV